MQLLSIPCKEVKRSDFYADLIYTCSTSVLGSSVTYPKSQIREDRTKLKNHTFALLNPILYKFSLNEYAR